METSYEPNKYGRFPDGRHQCECLDFNRCPCSGECRKPADWDHRMPQGGIRSLCEACSQNVLDRALAQTGGAS